jgi:uridine kinase
MVKKIVASILTKVLLITIVGSSGSGKTTFAKRLKAALEKIGISCVIVSVDMFYYSTKNPKTNFDHPDSINWEAFIDFLLLLLSGKEALLPYYNFPTHETIPEKAKLIQPCQVVICEGILPAHIKKIRNLSFLIIYIKTAIKICLKRRIDRDTTKRGRTEESVITQWYTTVLKMFKKFVEPTMIYAHKTFSGVGDNAKDIQEVVEDVQQKLKKAA